MNSGNKRTDAQIYILSHKKEDFILDNRLFTPIELGAYYNKEPIYDLRDNDDIDNISYLNSIFLEQTGTYYIYKHLLEGKKYVGINQHRRQFDFAEDTNFDDIFSKYKVILNKTTILPLRVKIHYEIFHNIDDFNEIEDIVSCNFPEYKDSFEKLKELNFLYANSCIVAPVNVIKDYFDFYFSIAWEFIKRKKLYNIDNIYEYGKNIVALRQAKNDDNKKRYYNKKLDDYKYQMRILGYLQERIMDLYMIHNFSEKDILTKNYRYINSANSKYNFNTIL